MLVCRPALCYTALVGIDRNMKDCGSGSFGQSEKALGGALAEKTYAELEPPHNASTWLRFLVFSSEIAMFQLMSLERFVI